MNFPVRNFRRRRDLPQKVMICSKARYARSRKGWLMNRCTPRSARRPLLTILADQFRAGPPRRFHRRADRPPTHRNVQPQLDDATHAD
jgi:hypothetical protein